MRGTVVFLSHTHPISYFKVGSHHLARELSHRGYSVLHVSLPISKLERGVGRKFSGRFNVLKNRKIDARDFLASKIGYFIDSDRVTNLIGATLFPVSWSNSTHSITEMIVELGFVSPDILFLDNLALQNVAKELHPKKMIYRPTDNHSDPVTLDKEREFLRVSDAIVVPSSYILDSLLRIDPNKPHLLLENGVEDDFFIDPGSENKKSIASPKSVVYVGAIDYRFDLSVVCALALEFPANAFDIYGPVSVELPSRLPKNLRFHGSVDYFKVPEILRASNVGIIPTNDSASNLGRSPMKFYEYLASGLFVLAKETPSLASRETICGAELYSTNEDAIAKLTHLLNREEDYNYEAVGKLESYRWENRASALIEFVNGMG